ncbi:bile acid:sodium symporter family protein [Nocardia sp. CDC159]|uniref:Bile acid:sodium symporter family protein n=1 Tax=Nocardia pulmonis TaxID=2951408 RepID=A0A9X2IU16_9NOCA|nr:MULTISPECIES: bile acid:sodium symporter family protein [Nocardia]MCM6772387.1 bile acid:sodium symporter family protein [Nocardia pulmonis]MCM6784955.1 bile acid:sodium symporter family protein [Nocardia sp. CDC159]
MGSLFAVFLPLALALVMFGLGLTLTVADFARVLRYPKAAAVALVCQMVLLPVVCLGLIYLFRLEGAVAAGMVLLAATPGGPSANLFSHVAGGNVALNITLTAVNSVLTVFTLPLWVGLAYTLFLDGDAGIGLRPDKFAQVFAIMLVPVALGMWVRHRFPGWAERARGTVKVASIVVLALVVLAAVARDFRTLTTNIGALSAVCLLLATIGLAVGYAVPRLLRIEADQAIAAAMEIGIHNGALAIAVATSVLHDKAMAVPPAVYGVLMNIPAAIAAYGFARRARARRAKTAAA